MKPRTANKECVALNIEPRSTARYNILLLLELGCILNILIFSVSAKLQMEMCRLNFMARNYLFTCSLYNKIIRIMFNLRALQNQNKVDPKREKNQMGFSVALENM